MQVNSEILYKTIGKIVTNLRKSQGITYTDFCYGNDIPMSTYDTIVNGSAQASFYNIAKIIKALGLNFKEFGELLDNALPEGFMNQSE